MEKNSNTVLGGFETILDGFIPKTEQEDNLENIKDLIDDNDDDKIDDPVVAKMKKDGVVNNDSNEDQGDDADDDPDGDTADTGKSNKSKQKDDDANKKKFDDGIDSNDSVDQFDEQQIVEGFFDALSEKLGWEDITDDERPKDIDSLIGYFQEIIDRESKPQYASDEVEALDNFVKQGGDIRNYLSIDAEINLDDIDIEDETNQKIVVKQLLKEKGFSDKQINKKIEKYIDAGLLEDEAQDAIEDLKEINQQKKEQLLQEQKRAYDNYVKQQRVFYNNVVDEIKNLDNIRGIAIPEKDKRVLIDYILKPDSDGMTKYQKDYRKGGIKNLIESAYFTMNADKLINSAKREGNNSAVERFKHSLKNTSINTKSRSVNNRKDNDTIWGSFTKHIRVS